ncbi:ATP-dependent DNA helicase PIF1 [Linum grandiflorum]
MSDDFAYRYRELSICPNVEPPSRLLWNQVLQALQNLLQSYSTSLEHFHLPYPDLDFCNTNGADLVTQHLRYDSIAELAAAENLRTTLNADQLSAYSKIMQSVDDDGAGLFFLYGHGGIGKTYLYKCIISEIRSRGHISLAVASSSIAATLLPDGCTAHSLFKIPLEVYHFSTCAVRKGKQLAELLRSATAIIWDEAPMIHRLSYEAVDRTLCESSGYKPFGGKIVIFGGDFRQTLPVITDGGRSDTINASLAKSYLWSHCQLLHLTINMRVVNSAINSQPVWGNMDFSKWILSVGDGLYKKLAVSYSSIDFIKNRTIVTPTNKVVSEINEYVLSRIPGKTKTYYSSDSITTDVNQLDSIYDAYPTEFLNTLSFNGVPEHELNLKLHTPVMILRNLNPSVGLCNGTRLFLTYLGKNVISGIIMGGNFERTQVVVPIIVLDVNEHQWPFTFKRCQFPIRLCYAMTINKSQGQTLDCVGLYLPKPVFSHGQLYVALSRVRSASGFHVLICGENSSKKYMTRNIVYQEIFETLH